VEGPVQAIRPRSGPENPKGKITPGLDAVQEKGLFYFKENFKFTPFLVKFTPFLHASDYMQIEFECVCLTPLMFI
jgi:hypothetical protein